jgi:triacylglycerol lipase
MKRWLRRLVWAVVSAAVVFGAGVLLRWPVAYPFDLLLAIGEVAAAPELAAVAAAGPRVVVLQHGLLRTPWSLQRLARCLRQHGYEVLDPGYPSTDGRIEAHAERLAQAIAARQRQGPVQEWSFVGHSMGGLVIQQYLRRVDHVLPAACVYLGTPHRGAILADLRRHWFLCRWTMGDGAAEQLSPRDLLHRLPIPYLDRSGAVVGDRGDGNPAIPGPDDGTVAVAEATLPGALAVTTLPVGHTALTTAVASQKAVLQFLRHRTFPLLAPAR